VAVFLLAKATFVAPPLLHFAVVGSRRAPMSRRSYDRYPWDSVASAHVLPAPSLTASTTGSCEIGAVIASRMMATTASASASNHSGRGALADWGHKFLRLPTHKAGFHVSILLAQASGQRRRL
jgi:hypothetical protein